MDTIPNEKAVEGVSKLLLAPLYLVYDILTALLPGILFCVLILGKGLPAPAAALGSSLVGYKTKVFLGVVVSYLVGRFFRSPVESLFYSWTSREIRKLGKTPKQGTELLQNVLLGMTFVPKLFKGLSIIDLIVLSLANAIFNLTTGLVLIVSSAIPGDGYLRLVEFCAGAMLLLLMLIGIRRFVTGFVVLLAAGMDLPTTLGPLLKLQSVLSTLRGAIADGAAKQPETSSTPPSPAVAQPGAPKIDRSSQTGKP